MGVGYWRVGGLGYGFSFNVSVHVLGAGLWGVTVTV